MCWLDLLNKKLQLTLLKGGEKTCIFKKDVIYLGGCTCELGEEEGGEKSQADSVPSTSPSPGGA